VNDPRVNIYVDANYYPDLNRGTLPQVSSLATNDTTGEHAPYNRGADAIRLLGARSVPSYLWRFGN
jgi:hypothetical protein